MRTLGTACYAPFLQRSFYVILVRFWYGFGTVLVRFWYNQKEDTPSALGTRLRSSYKRTTLIVTCDKIHCGVAGFCPNAARGSPLREHTCDIRKQPIFIFA